DDGLIADERPPAPVLRDEREQAMLNLVPFAGAGREMTNRDEDAELVGQGLQLALPQPDPRAIAAAAIGGDHKPGGLWIARAPHRLPPTANGIDREAGGIVIDAQAYPAGIVGDVVDAVGRRSAKLGDQEVVHPHRLGLTHGAVLTPAILEIADQLLLLGVDRDRRLARRQRLAQPCIEVTELRVAVGMAGSFEGLAVGLQAVAHRPQQIGHNVMADAMAQGARLRRLLAVHNSGAIGSPRAVGSTRSFRSESKLGSVTTSGRRPPPLRRTRSGPAIGAASPRSSASPRSIVLRATPVIRDTAVTPPCPAASASAAANRRRPRSFRIGSSASWRSLIAT